MNQRKHLAFAFMDPPFENERTTTFFRLLDAALDADTNISVFAYEGAVSLSFAEQTPHGNALHRRDTEEEKHPLTKDWIQALQNKASQRNLEFNWVNCGLCVDERGVNETIAGCSRGSPTDFWKQVTTADNTLVVGTR